MSKEWRIAREWEGQTCAIFAGGKSMTPAVAETVRVHATVRVIAVNNAYQLAPWADVLYAADAPWWSARLSMLGGKCHHDKTAGFLGIKCSVEQTPFDDVQKLRDSGKTGFDDDPCAIRTGGNSGYGAVHIAAHLGARRLLLCGFDMKGKNWHEPHPYPLRSQDNVRDRWIERFETLAPELARRGIEVLNCSPGSLLRCFPMADLSEALAARVAVAA